MMGERDLDDLFADARAHPARPSTALLARVLADAQALQPAPTAPRPPLQRPGFWARLAGGLGGGGVLAGLGSAAVAGLVIGIVQPAALGSVAQQLWAANAIDAVELLPDVTDFLDEG